MRFFKKLRINNLMILLTINLFSMLLWLTFKQIIIYWQYMYGYSYTAGSYSTLLFLSPLLVIILFSLLLVFYIIVVLIICHKHGIDNLIPAVLLLSLTFFLLVYAIPDTKETPYVIITNGLYNKISKAKVSNEISDWLEEYNFSEVSLEYFLAQDKWPKIVAELMPKEVRLYKIDSIKAIDLIYGGGFIGDFGVTVTEKPVDVPFNLFYNNEYRVQIQSNSFVWYEVKENLGETSIVNEK